MRKRESILNRAAIGALVMLSTVVPAYAAGWRDWAANTLPSWAAAWMPTQDWANYLFLGSFALLVVAVSTKVYMDHGAAKKPQPQPAESREYTIGDHRNRILNPFN
jgi:hypothetical protein